MITERMKKGTQTEDDAYEIDISVKSVLDEQEIKYTSLPIDGAYQKITDEIMNNLKYYVRHNLTIINDDLD